MGEEQKNVHLWGSTIWKPDTESQAIVGLGPSDWWRRDPGLHSNKWTVASSGILSPLLVIKVTITGAEQVRLRVAPTAHGHLNLSQDQAAIQGWKIPIPESVVTINAHASCSLDVRRELYGAILIKKEGRLIPQYSAPDIVSKHLQPSGQIS